MGETINAKGHATFPSLAETWEGTDLWRRGVILW